MLTAAEAHLLKRLAAMLHSYSCLCVLDARSQKTLLATLPFYLYLALQQGSRLNSVLLVRHCVLESTPDC